MTREQTGGSLRRPWMTTVVIGVVLPLIAAVVLIWSTTGRDQKLDRIPVAVVNNDTIITKPQPMAAGRALTAALTEPTGSDPNLDWTLTDSKAATRGLRDGDYYAVLTIPSDFSKAILSTGTNKPMRGKLQLTSNAAASSSVPLISEIIATSAANSLGIQTTEGYLGQIYDGFNQLAQASEKAAQSAAELASSSDQLAAGAQSLDESVDTLSSSLAQLAGGAADLATSAGAAADGAQQVAGGASRLAVDAQDLDDGSAVLARNARALAKGDATLARKAARVADAAGKSASASTRVGKGTRGVALAVAVLARTCERAGAGPVFCRALGRVRGGAVKVAGAASKNAVGSRELAAAVRKVAAGTRKAATAERRLARGAETLDQGAGRLSAGAGQLSNGASASAQGARELESGAQSLSAGASAAANGGSELAAASSTLSSGAASLDQGNQQLSQGLAQQASQSPTYSKKQKKALEPVVSEPVVLANTVQHDQHGNGWLLALVLGLVLWLAALLAALGRDLVRVLRHADAPVSSGRLASLQLGPAAGVALLQAVAVIVALPLLGVSTASLPSLVLLTLVAAATFTVVGVLLRWSFGTKLGVMAFVLLMVFQLAAVGNVVPLETAPGLLQRLNGILPLTVYVDAASQLVTGGQVGSLLGAMTVLLVWGLVAVLAAVLVVRRRRLASPQPV